MQAYAASFHYLLNLTITCGKSLLAMSTAKAMISRVLTISAHQSGRQALLTDMAAKAINATTVYNVMSFNLLL